MERRLFRELSRYYRLRQGQNAWARPSLLSLGKHGHDHWTYGFLLTQILSRKRSGGVLSAPGAIQYATSLSFDANNGDFQKPRRYPGDFLVTLSHITDFESYFFTFPNSGFPVAMKMSVESKLGGGICETTQDL